MSKMDFPQKPRNHPIERGPGIGFLRHSGFIGKNRREFLPSLRDRKSQLN
jgi:hypothetical protein